jgi:hypothetical protein
MSAKGLLARALGVVFSPRATYGDVAARPRVLGALLVILIISSGTLLLFAATQVGKDAMLDQADRTLQSVGFRLDDAQYARMEARMASPTAPYLSAASQLVLLPLLAAIVAGIVIAVFNGALGGDAPFKQVYAVVVHSGFLMALQQLFIYPLYYVKQSMASVTSLAALLPFLDEGTFAARLLGSMDLIRLWWIVNLAIGIGVLYKKRATPIAATMLAVYAAIALVVAAAGAALSGA